MKKQRIFLYCFLIGSFLLPGLAFSQWSNNAGINTPVVTANEGQSSHKILHDGHGGYFVVWHDNRDLATTNNDIYAQYFNAAGEPQWGANGTVVCNATNNQYGPKVTLDGVGGIIVSWYDYRGGANFDIYAQRLDATGTPNGLPTVSPSLPRQIMISVAGLSQTVSGAPLS